MKAPIGAAIALAAPFAISTVEVLALPHLPLPSGADDATVIGIGLGKAFFTSWLAARSPLGARAAVVVAVFAAATLVALTQAPATPLFYVLQQGAILAAASQLGDAIGRRVLSPGHLVASFLIASAFDVASVLSPSGVTHAIAESATWLHVLTVACIVPGDPGVLAAPLLGVGDLVMTSLALAALRRHEAPFGRAAFACALGAVAAVALAATLGRPIPALPFIGALCLASTREARDVSHKDRVATMVAATLAIGVVVSTLLRR